MKKKKLLNEVYKNQQEPPTGEIIMTYEPVSVFTDTSLSTAEYCAELLTDNGYVEFMIGGDNILLTREYLMINCEEPIEHCIWQKYSFMDLRELFYKKMLLFCKYGSFFCKILQKLG